MAPCISPTRLANKDLPEECVRDYEEARQVFAISPRASAPLLRLCLQKICRHLGETGKNINDDISNLVKKRLDGRIQKALDIVRVTANTAVHPRTMDLDDDSESAYKLLDLVNLVVSEMITKAKELEPLSRKLPKGALDAIEKRDGTANNPST